WQSPSYPPDHGRRSAARTAAEQSTTTSRNPRSDPDGRQFPPDDPVPSGPDTNQHPSQCFHQRPVLPAHHRNQTGGCPAHNGRCRCTADPVRLAPRQSGNNAATWPPSHRSAHFCKRRPADHRKLLFRNGFLWWLTPPPDTPPYPAVNPPTDPESCHASAAHKIRPARIRPRYFLHGNSHPPDNHHDGR